MTNSSEAVNYIWSMMMLTLVLTFNSVGANRTCVTPNGAAGTCMEIRQCTHILSELRELSDSIPPAFRHDLRRRRCNEFINEIYICCEFSPNQTLPKTVLPTTINMSSKNDMELNPKGLSLLMSTSCGPYIEERIICGFCSPTRLGEFPWMALLSYNDTIKFKCGGSLITNRYVLTAAHCITGPGNVVTGVRLGEHDIEKIRDCSEYDDNDCLPPSEDFGVEKIIPHAKFMGIKNDIALIRLDRNVEYKEHIQPICLPITERSKNIKENAVLYLAGWGTTEHGSTSNTLLKGLVPIKNLSYCQKIFRDPDISEQQICAGGDERVDSCKGDSGGPLFLPAYYQHGISYVQYGIISFGVAACGHLQSFPTVYTRIESYLPWITYHLATANDTIVINF